MKQQLEEILTELDGDHHEFGEDMAGFDFVLQSTPLSPFDYRIYGGHISQKVPQPIIRVESGRGDVSTFAAILRQKALIDGTDGEPGTTLEEKSHTLSQSLNLFAPWLGIFHSSAGSPRLTTRQTWFRFAGYLALDLFVARAAGSSWFQTAWRPEDNGGNIAAGLLLVRILGGFHQADWTRGHNRLAELRYTFELE